MKTKIFFAACLISLSFCSNVFAQEKTLIQGFVFDNNDKPIPYVNIFLLNTTEGTASDEDGSFSLKTNIKGQATIIASSVGYEKFQKEIELNGQTIDITIALSEKVINLKETVVMGSSFSSEKERGLVVSRIDVLTTPGGAADIYQSLKTLPGITQVSESAELYVRGGDPIETLTIIEGAPVYHPFTYESAYGGLFSNLNQSVMKSMYFSSGGFSSKYGNVLSGVLDIETKNQPQRNLIQLGLSLANASITADVPIWENKLGMYFDLRQNFTKPIFWLNGGGERLAVHPNSKSGSGGIVYSYSQTGKFKLFSMISQDEQGVEVKRAEYNGTFNGDSKNYFVNLSHSNILFEKLLIKNSIAFNQYSNQWTLGVLDLERTDYVYSFRNDFEYSFNSNYKMIAGFDFENRKISFVGKIPEDDFNIRPDAGVKVIDESGDGKRIGVYSEFQSNLIPGINNLSFAAGIRFDNFLDRTLNWFDPRTSLSYKINPDAEIKFGWGIFHQLPDPKLFNTVDGNPDLGAMSAQHFIASFDYHFNNQNSFRAEVYHKKYYDLPKENLVINYDNAGNGFADGVDVILKSNILGIDGWISYGFINTKRIWMDYEKLTSSSFDVTHNFAMVLKYNLTDYLQAGINAKYATGRPYTPVVSSVYRSDINIYEPIYGETNSGRFPDYKRLDLRLTYFGHIGIVPLVAYMEGLNILNFNNLFGYSYSADYSKQIGIESYFGRRMLVFGFMITLSTDY